MKIKQIIIAGTLLVSVASFSQKDELKALKKIYAKETPTTGDLTDYKAALSKLESSAIEESDKVYLNFYKANIPGIEVAILGANAKPEQIAKYFTPKNISQLASVYASTLEYEKKTGKKIYTDEIKENVTNMKPILWQIVVALDTEKKHKETSDVLYSIYQLDNTEQDKLYFAATYAINAKDYDTALKYLNELKKINYTGEGTTYFAKNKTTNQDENFDSNKSMRDSYVTLGTHILPREEKNPSKKPEIYKNIALILVEQGKNDEAIAALNEAKTVLPDDVSLYTTEADLYYKMNNMAKYKEVISKAIEKSPSDPVLYYNLGVTSYNAKQVEDAKKYYRKAIELKSDYFDAYNNLAIAILEPDEALVKGMNKLGNSAADLKQYEVLKKQREKLFTEVMPLYEKALELKPDNAEMKSNLKTVYNFLDLTDKYNALKK